MPLSSSSKDGGHFNFHFLKGVPMRLFAEPCTSAVDAYQRLSPRCLSVIKHENDLLMAYLRYDVSSYGIVSEGQYCRLSLEKKQGLWRMHLCDPFGVKFRGLHDYVDALNYVVFEHLSVDLDHDMLTMKTFEQRDIFFKDINLKINGTRILCEDEPGTEKTSDQSKDHANSQSSGSGSLFLKVLDTFLPRMI